MKRLLWTLWLAVGLISPAISGESSGSTPDSRWELASSTTEAGAPLDLYVEVERTPGRPAYRIETSFPVVPGVAATTLMQEMAGARDLPKGQERRVIERGERYAVVYTFIDLPFMLSDRELALRILHTDDPATGIHRIDWDEENEVLPPATDRVTRLVGTRGYWEFRPEGLSATSATYMTQADVGGSIPSVLTNRLMRAQAMDAVTRLRGLLAQRSGPAVASPPPASDHAAESLVGAEAAPPR